MKLVALKSEAADVADGLTPTDPLAPLAKAAVVGDTVAAQTLIASLAPALLRAVRGVLGASHPDVEDVAQEAAIGVLSALPTFRGECGVFQYACRVAVLTSMAARRRLRVRARVRGELPPDDEIPGGDELSPSERAAATRRRQVLRALLDELPEKQAEALVLHCVLGYSNEEVAATVGVPLNTVRSRLRVAKDVLRQRIQAEPGLQDELWGSR